jgi:hypothetical protein
LGSRFRVNKPINREPKTGNLECHEDMGRLLIILGILLIVLGILLNYTHFFSFIHLGRLPGDIRIKRGSFSFYFPLTTCILLSILLSLIFYIFRK